MISVKKHIKAISLYIYNIIQDQPKSFLYKGRLGGTFFSNCTASADTKLQLVTTNSSYHASMQILHHTASAINTLQLVAML